MKHLAQLDQAAHAILRWMIIVLMVVMTAIVFLQVVFRYIFDAPLDWSEELARFSFVWVSFLGAASLTRLRQHIDVTMFLQLLPRPLQIAASIAGHLLALTCVYFFLTGGIAMTSQEWIQLSPSVQVPMGWIYLCIPVAAGLMAIWILADLVRTIAAARKGDLG